MCVLVSVFVPSELSVLGIALFIPPFHSISDLFHLIGTLSLLAHTNQPVFFHTRLHHDQFHNHPTVNRVLSRTIDLSWIRPAAGIIHNCFSPFSPSLLPHEWKVANVIRWNTLDRKVYSLLQEGWSIRIWPMVEHIKLTHTHRGAHTRARAHLEVEKQNNFIEQNNNLCLSYSHFQWV